jgi:hypothetical protein
MHQRLTHRRAPLTNTRAKQTLSSFPLPTNNTLPKPWAPSAPHLSNPHQTSRKTTNLGVYSEMARSRAATAEGALAKKV